MDSGGSISKAATNLMPFLAILRHELGILLSSWLVRLWFGASLLWTLLTIAGNWNEQGTVFLTASLMSPYLVAPWFIVVVLLGLGPVTGSRLDALADGILSRPVTRHEYLLASWAARVLVVLTVFLGVILPCLSLVLLADRPDENGTVTLYGITATLCVVSLVLTFLVTLGFLVGTLLRSPLLAAALLVLVWIPINLVPFYFALEQFSPLSLSQSLPQLLVTPWNESDVEDRQTAEDLEAAAQQAVRSFVALMGGQPERQEPQGFLARGEKRYEDFSLLRVLAGYGIPTLLALGLALASFSRRDL